MCLFCIIGTCEATVFFQTSFVGLISIFLCYSRNERWERFQYVAIVTLLGFGLAAFSPGHDGRLGGNFGPLKGDLLGVMAHSVPLFFQLLENSLSNRFIFGGVLILSLWAWARIIGDMSDKERMKLRSFGGILGFSLILLCYIIIVVAIFRSGHNSDHVDAIIPRRAQLPVKLYLAFSYFVLVGSFISFTYNSFYIGKFKILIKDSSHFKTCLLVLFSLLLIIFSTIVIRDTRNEYFINLYD